MTRVSNIPTGAEDAAGIEGRREALGEAGDDAALPFASGAPPGCCRSGEFDTGFE